MEPAINKDQDPPHGGSFVRRADGSLELMEGPTLAAAPAAAPETTKPAPVAGVDQE